MKIDAIVIGSGFGGAVAACRLSQAGLKVVVLERGRRWEPSTFPREPGDPWLWDHRDPRNCNGWFDIRTFPNMAVAQGAGVGGGSLVYANISCEAPASAFESGWPAQITYEGLKPHYDRVGKMMEVQKVPANQWTDRMRLMQAAAAETGNGDRFGQLELAVRFDPNWTYDQWGKKELPGQTRNVHGAMQGTCVHLGNCDVGCEANARNTLDLNYLYVAEEKHHAEVRQLHLVELIELADGAGYKVHYHDLKTRMRGVLSAEKVFVCAGSLGSTELLLKCKQSALQYLSGHLGRGWSSNGDFLTPAFHPGTPVHADRGPTIASYIDFHDGSRDGKRFWIQDGGIPNLARAFIDSKLQDPATGWKARLTLTALRELARGANPFEHLMPWFAQGVDASDGTLSLRPGEDGVPQLHLDWDVRKSEALINEIVATHKELAIATGGIPLVPPSWSVFRDLVTPHPLGGCNMGTSAWDGVVNDKGEVFGYPGLYVLDGAIVPQAIGVNPSRTIAALAERAMHEILQLN